MSARRTGPRTARFSSIPSEKLPARMPRKTARGPTVWIPSFEHETQFSLLKCRRALRLFCLQTVQSLLLHRRADWRVGRRFCGGRERSGKDDRGHLELAPREEDPGRHAMRGIGAHRVLGAANARRGPSRPWGRRSAVAVREAHQSRITPSALGEKKLWRPRPVAPFAHRHGARASCRRCRWSLP